MSVDICPAGLGIRDMPGTVREGDMPRRVRKEETCIG